MLCVTTATSVRGSWSIFLLRRVRHGRWCSGVVATSILVQQKGQQRLMVLLPSLAAEELQKLGAKIIVKGKEARVYGQDSGR
jgi:hypothetical protein